MGETFPSEISEKVHPSHGGESLHYSAIGGWLKFFCIVLTIISPIFNLLQIGSLYGSAHGKLDILDTYITISSIVSIVLIIFSIRAGYALWTIKPNAVKIAKNYLKLYMGCDIGVIVLAYMILPSEMTNAMGVEFAKNVVGDIVFVGIWYFYLSKSRRVKATYTSNLIIQPLLSEAIDFSHWSDGKIIGGVCTKIGIMLNKPILILPLRLFFIIATFFYGIGLILYIILWIILPSLINKPKLWR